MPALPDTPLHRRRIRVAMVSLGLDMGGKERVLLDLARRCDSDRFELQAISLGGRGSLAPLFEASGCPVHAMAKPRGFAPSLTFRLARLFQANAFDVVHSHDDRSAIHALPAAVLAGVKRRVHTQHHSQIFRSTPLSLPLLAFAAKLAQAFVCVSDAAADLVRGEGIEPPRLRVIHNGVDLDSYSFVGNDPRGSALTVAVLSPKKDIPILLKAAAALKPRLSTFRLRIAGGGPSRNALMAMAQKLGIPDIVSFLGERSDVPELLAQSRLYVLPSREEGLSLAILEAMARGIPVIATRVGGTPELVVDGETGMLVEVGNVEALACAMAQLWSDSALASRLGRAGRAKAEDKFDIRRTIAKYEALYRDGPAAEPS